MAKYILKLGGICSSCDVNTCTEHLMNMTDTQRHSSSERNSYFFFFFFFFFFFRRWTSFNWRFWPSQRHPTTLLYPGHRLSNFFIFIWPRSCMMLPSHLHLGLPLGLSVKGFHLNTFLVALASGILCTWPNQLSLWALMQLTVFSCFISLSSSSLFLILHVWFCFVGPNTPL